MGALAEWSPAAEIPPAAELLAALQGANDNARITARFVVEETGLARGWGRAEVALFRPLEYHVGAIDSGEIIVVPRGFVTDFASIPFGFRNLFPPLGPWARAAIIHDLLYGTSGTGIWQGERYISRERPYSRAEADAIFLEAMKVVGVPAWRRAVMYRAVRLGGAGGWGS